MTSLHIDCDRCVARGPDCADCVVTVLLGLPGHPDDRGRTVDLDEEEQVTLAALAGSGLVPPLRLVPGARPARAVQPPLDRLAWFAQ